MRNLYLSHATAPALSSRTYTTAVRSTEIHPTLYWGLVLLILVITVFLRTWDVSHTDLWSDEVITTQRVNGSLDETFESLYQVGNQAPLYYLLMRLFPNDSPFLIRFPAILLGVLSVALAMHIVWELYQNRWMMLWLGAVLAVHPLHIILSRTARFYTLLLVLGLVITYCFVLIMRGRGSRRVWIVFLSSSLLAYLTHYSALALPATQGLMIVWQWNKLRRIVWRWAWGQFAAVLPFIGWLALTLSHYDGSVHEVANQFATIKDVPLSFMNLVTGYDDTFNWLVMPGLLIGLIGLAFGVMNVLAERKTEPETLYWLLLAVVPVLVMFVINQLTGANYRDRYFLTVMPAALLIFWIGWQRDTYLVRQVALGATLLTNVYLTLAMFSARSYERTDWGEAGNYIEERFQPGDKLLFESDMFYTAFSTYFEGEESTLSASAILLDDPNAEQLEAGADRVWAVYRVRHEDFHRSGWVEDIDPMTPGLSPISDWLAAHRNNIVARKPFKGGVIYLVDQGDNLAQR